MRKQSFGRIKKALIVLLLVFFIVSLTTASVSAWSTADKGQAIKEKHLIYCDECSKMGKNWLCSSYCIDGGKCKGLCIHVTNNGRCGDLKAPSEKGSCAKQSNSMITKKKYHDDGHYYVWDTQCGCPYGYRCPSWCLVDMGHGIISCPVECKLATPM